jgi:hypothetical protein
VSSCYSLAGGVWTRQPSIKEGRYHAAGTITEKGFLITGGLGGGGGLLLSSTEYFSSGVWKSGPALPVAIVGHCQITVGSAVYVIGRYSGVGKGSNIGIYRRL